MKSTLSYVWYKSERGKEKEKYIKRRVKKLSPLKPTKERQSSPWPATWKGTLRGTSTAFCKDISCFAVVFPRSLFLSISPLSTLAPFSQARKKVHIKQSPEDTRKDKQTAASMQSMGTCTYYRADVQNKSPGIWSRVAGLSMAQYLCMLRWLPNRCWDCRCLFFLQQVERGRARLVLARRVSKTPIADLSIYLSARWGPDRDIRAIYLPISS